MTNAQSNPSSGSKYMINIQDQERPKKTTPSMTVKHAFKYDDKHEHGLDDKYLQSSVDKMNEKGQVEKQSEITSMS